MENESIGLQGPRPNKAWIDGRSGLVNLRLLVRSSSNHKKLLQIVYNLFTRFSVVVSLGPIYVYRFSQRFSRLKFGSKGQPLKKAVLNPVSMAQLLTCTHFRDNLFHTNVIPFVIKSGFILWFAPRSADFCQQIYDYLWLLPPYSYIWTDIII